jgi:hypothetical protein
VVTGARRLLVLVHAVSFSGRAAVAVIPQTESPTLHSFDPTNNSTGRYDLYLQKGDHRFFLDYP